MPGRYILRYRGSGAAPGADLKRIQALDGVAVFDSTSRMLLVEGPGESLIPLIDSMPDWVLSEERMIPLPDARPKIQRGT